MVGSSSAARRALSLYEAGFPPLFSIPLNSLCSISSAAKFAPCSSIFSKMSFRDVIYSSSVIGGSVVKSSGLNSPGKAGISTGLY